MQYPLPIGGECLDDLVSSLISQSHWRERDGILYHEGQEVFATRSQGKAYLPLLPSAEKSEEMLRWFCSPELSIRPAGTSDIETLSSLKERSIRQSFTFFSEEDMQIALHESASEEYMAREIAHHDFWIGLNNGVTQSVAGLKKIDYKTSFLYSVYSEGGKGGAALVSLLIYRARRQGYQKLTSNVYKENSYGARLLEQFGFRKDAGELESTYVPGYPINRWTLDLS